MMQLRIVLFALAVSRICDAQVPAIAPGARVRMQLREPAGLVEGTAILQTTDSVVIAVFGAVRIAVHMATIARIQVGNGRTRLPNARRGLWIGSLVGIPLGLVEARDDRTHGDTDTGAWVAAYVVEGAILGALIGSAYSSEKWKTVYTKAARLSLQRGAAGAIGAGLAIRF